MNINTRDLSFLNFNETEMQWLKYNNLLVWEAWEELKASGLFPLTLNKCKGEDLVDYKIYGESVQGLLPAGYQQVEYIESSGTQYIDTGVSVTTDTKIETNIAVLYCTVANNVGYEDVQIETQDYNLLGSYGNRTGLALGVYEGKFRWWNAAPQTQVFEYVEGQKYNVVLNDNGVYSVDGVEQTLTSTTVPDCANSIYIFDAQHTGTPGTPLKPGALRLYTFKIYTGRELVRSFIPCYRKSDNVIGLYDLVNGVFYTNSGTGTFLKGNNAPTPEAPIEIESVGDRTKNLIPINSYELTGASLNETIFKGNLSLPAVFSWDIDYTPKNGAALFVLEIDGTKKYCAAYGKKEYLTGTTLTQIDIINWPQDVGNVTKIQLNQETVPIDYEPYGYKVPVKAGGKNLINKDQLLDGFVKSDGTIESVTWYKCTDFLSVSGEYLYLQNTTASSSSLRHIVFFDKDKNVISTQIQNVDNNKTIITMPKGTAFVRLNVKLTSDLSIASIVDFEDYEPYVEPVTTNIYLNEPLRKIRDVSDIIDFENKKIIRNIAEIKLTDEDGWTYQNTKFVTNKLTDIVIDNERRKKINVLSDHYNGITTDFRDGMTDMSIMKVIGENPQIAISDSRYTTVDEFKAFLKSNPITIQYILATPKEEAIELPNIPTHKGTTILSVDTEIQPSNAEVIYMGKK